jgi:hypothetical protein
MEIDARRVPSRARRRDVLNGAGEPAKSKAIDPRGVMVSVAKDGRRGHINAGISR